MFQFTTTTVINSQNATDYNGTPLLDDKGVVVPKFKGEAGVFTVAKVGTFKQNRVKALYKKAYEAGVREEAELDVPTAEKGDKLRLTLNIKLDGSVQAEYANYYKDFQQPVTVEITAEGDAADDAEALVKAINKIKTYFGKGLVSATNSTGTITFKAVETVQRFGSIKLEKIGPAADTAVAPTITLLAEGTVETDGKIGFGDDAWMIKSVRVPTYGNNRAFGTNKEETPILGGQYTQYTLHYEVPRQGRFVYHGGLSTETTHVFYVVDAEVANFDDALEAAGIDTIEVSLTKYNKDTNPHITDPDKDPFINEGIDSSIPDGGDGID